MIVKRIIKFFIIITISIFTTQIVYANDIIKKESIVVQAFDTDNVFTIDYGSEGISQSQAVNYLNEAKKLTLKLSDLSDNFYPSNDYVNVYYINKNPETTIEIDKMLYDLLVLSEQYRIKTDGYFNIAIGEIIDGWKELLQRSDDEKLIGTKYESMYISKTDYDDKVREIKSIPIIEDGIKLTNEHGKYYVCIKQGVKIDLGGIAKGYGVELVDRCFKQKQLSYYSLSGSESSLKYGKNAAREGDYFHIGINHPYVSSLYGYVKVKNISLTTSGDTFQKNTLYGRFVHHIVSPKTREPENNYRSISLLTDDAGYGDVLSTAMFSMDESTLKSWAKKNNIEFIAIKYDGEVINQLGDTELVILNDKMDKKPDVKLYASEYEVTKEYKKDQQLKVEFLLNDLKQIISYEIIESTLTKDDRKEVESLLQTYVDKKTKIDSLKIDSLKIDSLKVNKNLEIKNYVNSMLLDLNEYTLNIHNDSNLDSSINFVRHYFKKTDIVDKKRGPNAALIEWTAVGLTIVALGVAFYFMGRKRPTKQKEE